jgi:hypothetical protein
MAAEQNNEAERAPEGDMLVAYETWLKQRGPLGVGAMPERIFFAGWLAARRPSAPIGEDGLPISDAEIAGIMGWRGPGAYTEATLRKIRRVVEHAIAADRRAREVTVTNYGNPVDKCGSPLAAQGVSINEDVEFQIRLCDVMVAAKTGQNVTTQSEKVQSLTDWLDEQFADLRAQLARQSHGVSTADIVSIMLWLYRRLPRAYGRPPHVEAPIAVLAKAAGIDVADSFSERDPAPPLSSEQQADKGEKA